jgi:DNA adenine methylase
LIDALVHTPYARQEYEIAFAPRMGITPIERARRTAVRAGMGFGSSGATKRTCGFRVDTRREYSTAQHVWARYPDTLGAIGERFAGVLIEHRDAVSVMMQHDAPTTLHYVDPPYVSSTREENHAYRHEMSEADHEQLLTALTQLRGMVLLSGYANPLYEARLKDWHCVTRDVRAAGQRGSVPRVETLWINPACWAELGDVCGAV